MEQYSSSEGNNPSASQEIPHILRNSKRRTAFTSVPPTAPTQCQDARVPASSSYNTIISFPVFLTSHNFSSYLCRNWGNYYIFRGTVLFPICISRCPLLSAILSHLFPSGGHLKICGNQAFVSVQETDGSPSTADQGNVQDIPGFFRYKIIRHINLFCDRLLALSRLSFLY